MIDDMLYISNILVVVGCSNMRATYNITGCVEEECSISFVVGGLDVDAGSASLGCSIVEISSERHVLPSL